MARPTQLWPGERMRTFFRSIFRGEAGVSDELADRLADVCERHINRMLVWNSDLTVRSRPEHVPQTASKRSRKDKKTRSEAKKKTSRPTTPPQSETSSFHEDPITDISNTEAGAPWSAEHLEDQQPDTMGEADTHPAQSSTQQSADQEPAFDPFAFSAIVILARAGADALMQRLKEIKSTDHLRELANAQHLGVELSVKDAPGLRKAIVRGAKQRLADRRAAAS